MCMCVTYLCLRLPTGLFVTSFRGHPNVQHVQCTGEALTSDSNVLLMTLFEHPNDTTVASVNYGNNQCSTSAMFSSCEIDVTNSRKTRVNTLLVDLPYGEVRVFGCNVTFSRAHGRSGFKTWFLGVNVTGRY